MGEIVNQPSINVMVLIIVVWGFFLISQKNEGWISRAGHLTLCSFIWIKVTGK